MADSRVDELVDSDGSMPSVNVGGLAEYLTGTVLWWIIVPIAAGIELFFDGLTTALNTLDAWLFTREPVLRRTPSGYVREWSETGFFAAVWDLPEQFIAGAADGFANFLTPYGVLGYLIGVLAVMAVVFVATWALGVIVQALVGRVIP